MAVINLVIEAIGTTWSAPFTSNSSEVLSSTTSAIFDLTFRRDRGYWDWEDFLGTGFGAVVEPIEEVRIIAGVASSPWAAKAVIVLAGPQKIER